MDYHSRPGQHTPEKRGLCRWLEGILKPETVLIGISADGGIVRENWLEPPDGLSSIPRIKNKFRYSKTSPDIVRLAIVKRCAQGGTVWGQCS